MHHIFQNKFFALHSAKSATESMMLGEIFDAVGCAQVGWRGHLPPPWNEDGQAEPHCHCQPCPLRKRPLPRRLADDLRHLVQELANNCNKGFDACPSTLTATHELMLHGMREQDSRPQPCGNQEWHSAQQVEGGPPPAVLKGVPSTNAQPNPCPDTTCHKCKKMGHFSNKCAEATHANDTTLLLCGVMSDGAPPVADSEPGGDTAFTLLGSMGDIHGFEFMNNGE